MKHNKINCIGCIKLDVMALCGDNEALKETMQRYFEEEHNA